MVQADAEFPSKISLGTVLVCITYCIQAEGSGVKLPKYLGTLVDVLAKGNSLHSAGMIHNGIPDPTNPLLIADSYISSSPSNLNDI